MNKKMKNIVCVVLLVWAILSFSTANASNKHNVGKVCVLKTNTTLRELNHSNTGLGALGFPVYGNMSYTIVDEYEYVPNKFILKIEISGNSLLVSGWVNSNQCLIK